MKKIGFKIATVLSVGLFSSSLMAAEFMSPAWATQACAQWNKTPVLTDQLAQMPETMFGEGYEWIKNDKGRGYKIVQIYRQGCESDKIQLNIANKNGKAMCTYGGKPDGKKMDKTADYVMYATDTDWACMGSGKCGVMGSMMTGKLKFVGPKVEAMKVMDPFSAFLKLTGKVPAEKKKQCK